MAEYIVMPKLGFDMREGLLSSWLKQPGDEVNKGDVVAEIESDKATLELESQVAGTLLKHLEEAGAVVPIGANLAIVGEEGEDIAGLDGDQAETAPAADSGNGQEAEAQPVQVETPVQATTGMQEVAPAADSGEFPGGVRATPVARRMARELNIDLAQVSGSGPDGRIRKADVEAFQTQPRPEARPAETPDAAPAPASAPAPTDVTEIAPSRLRQAIGRRMTESKTTVPHFYVTNEIDMAAVMELRRQINSKLPEDNKVTVNDLIVKAAALALRDFPNLNAAYVDGKILQHQRINVGSAVAVEGGLLTVVQKDTDTSTLSKIAADHKAMIGRAREGKIKTDDVEGGTFTVSNLGGFDVDHFIAIINPPDAAILAIGSARQVPVVVDGEIAVGMRMKATISADHRVTDGAEAARYMQAFKALLEEPLRLLL
jgi:pyruvate dehydrogenase E2 component (dihydrolipoamide acetyltransferase)